MKREECFKIVNLFDELDELQKCLRDFRLGVDCALVYKSNGPKNFEGTIPIRVTRKLIENLETTLRSEVSRVKSELNNLGAETEEEALAPSTAVAA
jgi:hypothetical protein